MCVKQARVVGLTLADPSSLLVVRTQAKKHRRAAQQQPVVVQPRPRVRLLDGVCEQRLFCLCKHLLRTLQ